MNTIENHIDDYDSPWKEGMELYFKELMQFFRNDTPGNGPLPGRSMKKAFPQKTF